MVVETPNPAANWVEGFVFTRVGQDEQGLGSGFQLAPPRPVGGAVGADGAGEEVQGMA
ncbi:hypothetical protein [Thermobifida halotolerans]|uniref:hypothetical protein n=1 Tax=Thermobifida halotolerans TaxID=483545 RepID=UPI000ACE87A9|nr:hypothetical protein [Thermobifida halotolerans]